MIAAVIALGVLSAVLAIALGGAVVIVLVQRESIATHRARREADLASEWAATQSAQRLMRAVMSPTWTTWTPGSSSSPPTSSARRS